MHPDDALDHAPANLEACIALIVKHEDPSEWSTLATRCRKMGRGDLVNVGGADVHAALNKLDANKHPVGFAYILFLGCRPHGFSHNALSALAAHWLLCCPTKAMKIVTKEVSAIARSVAADAMGAPDAAERALPQLMTALRAMQKSVNHLTPFHAAYLQCAIKCKRYYSAMKLLNEEIYHLSNAGLTHGDYLLYGYYGALCCMACKELPKALRLLELVISVPTAMPDAIVLAAWRRFVLVTALHSNQVASPPKHASVVTRRELKDDDIVVQLAKHYVSGNATAFDQVLLAKEALLHDQGVLGLSMQLKAKLPGRTVKQMPRTYLTKSLPAIAQDVGLPDAQAAAVFVCKMVDAGEIDARIDEQEGMVEFFDDDDVQRTNTLLPMLNQRIKQIQELQDRLQSMTRSVQLEPRYIKQQMHAEGNMGTPEGMQLPSMLEASMLS